MRYTLIFCVICILILFGCQISPTNKIKQNNGRLDIQGHRGARGIYPENSISGFIYAVKLGISTIELDLAVSADSQLIVSHEPFFSPIICKDKFGNSPSEADSINNNIFKMNWVEIQNYDCGLSYHPRFPNQIKMPTSKPSLKQVIDTVESLIKLLKTAPVYYNIEIKTQESTDNIFHPKPEVFADLVASSVEKNLSWERVIIQSFDFRVLQYFHTRYPQAKLALLIENELPWQKNTDSLGFIPHIYSPYFELLDEPDIYQLHEKKCKVIPWTVNESHDIRRLLTMNIDGIISDYPQRVLDVLNEK